MRDEETGEQAGNTTDPTNKTNKNRERRWMQQRKDNVQECTSEVLSTGGSEVPVQMNAG